MTRGSALKGLRVLDWTDETGRLAGKLLAEAGADVLRLRRGNPGRPLPGSAGARGGVLDWWYDAGVRRLELDLATPADRELFLELAARADVLIETMAPGFLDEIGADYPTLSARNPRLVHVSLTPFGRTGPRALWQVSDLVMGALGGPISVTGTPEQPLNTFGRQCFNVGGFYAAICALAGVHGARETGQGQYVDLSLHQAVISCSEQVLMYWFFQNMFGPLAPRQGSLHWTGLYQVMPCRVGFALMTPAPNPVPLREWIEDEDGMRDVLPQPVPISFAELYQRSREMLDGMRKWAATKDASELFAEARRRHLALAEVLTLRRAAESPQFSARNFFRPVGDEFGVRSPGPLFRMLASPAPEPLPPPAESEAPNRALAAWPQLESAGTPPATAERRLLDGVRILDFTWVLAGPFATRALGDLGADVIKLQAEERTLGANHNDFPFFILWNRNKRSAALNMKHARAIEIVRRLVERADVVIDNFSRGVLERWGIGYAAARTWNSGIIYVSMSGCGRDGPWHDLVTYAPSIHALCGLTHLTNPSGSGDLGCGVSLSDHVSGLAGAIAVLAALAHRRRSGEGQLVDLAQLEVGAYMLGPAFVELLATGVEAQPAGNRDGFEDLVPNEIYRCADQCWLAVTARTDEEWQRLCGVIGATDLAGDARLRTAAGRRAYVELIDRRLAAWAAHHPAADAATLLQSHRVAAGMMQTARDLVETDPQLRAREWLAAVEHTTLGPQQIDRFPGLFSRTSLAPYRAAPALHEHTFEVYAELLGMTEEDIAAAIGDGLFV